MKRVLLPALLVFSSFVSSFSFADEASHRQAATELLEVTNVKATLDQMMTSMDGMIDQTFTSMGVPADDSSKKVKTELMSWLGEFFVWEKMQPMYTDIYVEVFTEDELKEMIAFYKTPIGQKMLAKMPELMQKSMQKSQAMLQEKMPEFQQRLQKSLTEMQKKS